MNGLVYLFSSLACGIAGQLLLKKGMNKIGRINLLNKKISKTILTLWKTFTNWIIICGVVVFGVSMLLWMLALSSLELSFAYPLVSISYVSIALLSKIFFSEKVSSRRWLSIGVICLGVAIVGLSF